MKRTCYSSTTTSLLELFVIRFTNDNLFSLDLNEKKNVDFVSSHVTLTPREGHADVFFGMANVGGLNAKMVAPDSEKRCSGD